MTTITSKTSLASSIESELFQVKENLKGVDESLKRIMGKDFTQPRTDKRNYNINRDFPKTQDPEPATRRKVSTGIFARLGAPILDNNRKENRENRHRMIDFSGNKEKFPAKTPTLLSSVARPVHDVKSRTEAVAELTKDRTSHNRNRRMFGTLMGTLQKFQDDEAKQKGKDDQRAAIEKKLEEKGKAEKEELRREKMDLFNQRMEQQAKIKFLQYKMNRIREHDCWENHQKKLRKFIRTDSKPNIFWLPKVSTENSMQLIKKTKMTIDRELEDKRNKLKEELEECSYGKKGAAHEKDLDTADEPQVKKMKLAEDILEDTLGDLEENCDDILDFEMEEPRQVEEVNPSGKGSNPERVVVQVGSGMNGLGSTSQRRVELVPAATRQVVAKLHRKVKVENDCEMNEIKVCKVEKCKESKTGVRAKSKDRAKVYKSRKSGETNVVLSENQSTNSEREVRECSDTVQAEEKIVKKEESNSKPLDNDKREKDNVVEVMDVEMTSTPAIEMEKVQNKSPVPETDMVTGSPKRPAASGPTPDINTTTVHDKKTVKPLPAVQQDDASSSSSSEDSDDFDDSSSTSDSETTDSSDSSSSSTSTDSETERKRDLRKKSIQAVRKREEERRRQRSSSNSSSGQNEDKSRSKRSRGSSPKEKRTSSQSKVVKRRDDKVSKDKRKRSASRERHRTKH